MTIPVLIFFLDWEDEYFHKVWPNWKAGIHDDLKEEITDISMYKHET